MSFVNESPHQRIFSVESWMPSFVTWAPSTTVGVSDANCHHEFLDLHTEHDDIILEEDKETGEDRSLQPCCESRNKQTKRGPDNFPFNWFKLGIPQHPNCVLIKFDMNDGPYCRWLKGEFSKIIIEQACDIVLWRSNPCYSDDIFQYFWERGGGD